MPQKLRVGIAGLNRGGDFLAPLDSWDDTTVTAVCDPDPAAIERRRSQLGAATVFRRFPDMLDSGLDAVIIATPIHLHVPHAVEALKRGIHVFSEVSAAVSLQQCEDLVRAVRSSSARYMMGENCCFMKEFSIVGTMARAGVFGHIYYAEADCVLEIAAWARPGSWKDQWLLRRPGPTYITHPLGTVLDWLDDRVVSVNCLGTGANVDPARGNDDCSIMLCRTSKGALVKIRHDLTSPRPMTHNYAALQGTKGAYEARRHPRDDHRVCLAAPGGKPPVGSRQWQLLSDFEQQYLPDEWRGLSVAPEDPYAGSDGVVMRAFVDCLLNNTAPRIDVYRALDFTVPGLMAEESLKLGGAPVAVPDFRCV